MQAERNELIGRVFPNLRRWLEPLGIDLVEIDLRWGVPREHPYSLLACLEEVDACHPFFLCFLGHQCGSLVAKEAVPRRQDLPSGMRSQHEQLQRFIGRGYTEVEIWRALLGRTDAAVEALFYFRQRSWSDALVAEIRKSLDARQNSASAEGGDTEWARQQMQAVLERAAEPEQLRQMEELRRAIEEKIGPVPDYGSPEELGRRVEEDLRARISVVLREPQELSGWRTPAPQWLALHSRRYFGEAGNFMRLNRALRGGGPVILWGSEGGGSTALLAAWARLAARGSWTDPAKLALRSWWPGGAAWTEGCCARVARRYANRIWISAEALGAHADWRELVRWLVGELARVAGETVDTGCTVREAELTRRLLPQLLERAASGGRLLIIIDGLDYLANASREDPLAWLPATMPAGVALLVSVRYASERFQRSRWRGWRNVMLPAGSSDERRRLIEALLRCYGKELRACGGADLILDNVARSPRHLEQLADWLRRAGYEQEAEARARSVAGATTIAEFTAVLLRAAARELKGMPVLGDFDAEKLFAEALGYIVLARGGLSETTLRELLGPEGERLFAVAWIPILDRLKGFLRESLGLYLPQPGLYQAVSIAWPVPADADEVRRRKLASYFARRLPAPEALRESPWQWFQVGDGAALLRFIAQPDYLVPWLRARPVEAEIVWAKLAQDNSKEVLERCLDGLASEMLAPTREIPDAVEIGIFVSEHAPGPWRLSFWTNLQQRARTSGTDVRLLWRCLAETARAHAGLRQWKEAETSWRDLAAMQRQISAHDFLTESLVELSGLLEKLGRVSEAADLMPEVRSASEAAGDLWSRMSAAKTRGRFLTRSDRGEDFQKALECFRDAESCARLVGNVYETVAAIGQQGDLLMRLEKYGEALDRHLEEARLAEQIGDKQLLQAALGGQAAVALARAEFDEVERVLGQRKKLADELGNPFATMQTVMQYAQIDLRWAEASREESRRKKNERLAMEKCADILRLAEAHGLENSETAGWARQLRDRLRDSGG